MFSQNGRSVVLDSRVGLDDGVGLLDGGWVFLRERLGWFWPEEEATAEYSDENAGGTNV